MENEIKVGEYVRIVGGIIARITNKNKDGLLIDKVIRDPMRQDGTIRDWCIFNNEKKLIVKHSPNLIDLIQCGDYVNGYKVTNVINKEPCPSGKCVDIDADRPSEYCTLWEDNIETVVTKEEFESITYKVTKM